MQQNKLIKAGEVSRTDAFRTSLVCNRKIHGSLFGISPVTGTLQATVNILLTKLITALEKHGITEYDPAGYEQFVLNCTIVPVVGNGGAVVDTSPQATDRNVRHGTVRMAQETPRPSVESSDAVGASTLATAEGSDGKRTKRVIKRKTTNRE